MSSDSAMVPPGSEAGDPNTMSQATVLRIGDCTIHVKQDVVLAKGPMAKKAGRIVYHLYAADRQPRADLRLGNNHVHRNNTRGHRANSIPVADDAGAPLPEVKLLFAVLTGRLGDRLEVGLPPERYYDGRGRSSPNQVHGNGSTYDPLKSMISREAFEEWAADRILQIIKDRRILELVAWEAAARRALDVLNLTTVEEDLSKQTSEYGRILVAIQRATLACAGVPHQMGIREILAVDGGPEMTKEKVRTTLIYLGFDWIPSHTEWEKTWPMVARSKGWE